MCDRCALRAFIKTRKRRRESRKEKIRRGTAIGDGAEGEEEDEGEDGIDAIHHIRGSRERRPGIRLI